ncbi:peptide ABC transporter substrate-binding protein [Acidithiobacillus marinus]|uniref:Peptide ABC transporter substrate-binding protein n=1 Tax=Acidithiobacillus marinus TaxID=187490 RepID=A0A2I1DN58_9PROT|nr:peptide ABC transporter substrate-binding protein [Acidithiobacillus marinus]PKY11314.1 peptide ABC transporter substrate-binding protein [Acidithiobacillus marinus]
MMRDYRIVSAVIGFMLFGYSLSSLALSNADSLTTVTSVGLSPPMNVNSLLPVVNNDSSANIQIITLMFRPLLWVGTNLKINWDKSIAKSITVSGEGKQYVIHLKLWHWSNGRPVTAEDTLACLKMIQEYGSRYPNAGMGGMPELIKTATIINQDTLKITLKRAVNPNWFELNGLSQLFPVPARRWKNYSINDLYKMQDNPNLVAVVDGPFKLKSFTQGRSISFIRNSSYSGKLSALKVLRFKMYTSDASAFWALKTGDIQAGMIPHYLFDARWMVKNLQTCISNGGYGFNYVTLNLDNPKVSFFRDVKVRQALALAVNQKQIIQTAFHGLGVPSFNPVPTNPDTYLSPKMKKLVANPTLAYNPDAANKLLAASGWKLGPKNIRIHDGQRLQFTMMVPDTSQTLIAVAELLKADWRAIGVDMRLRVLPFNLELTNLQPHGKWDASMIVWSYNPDFYPSGDGLFNTDGGANYGKYSSHKMDKLIRESATNKDIKYLYAYENYAYQQQPVIFLPYPEYVVKYSQSLKRDQLMEGLYSVNCKPALLH